MLRRFLTVTAVITLAGCGSLAKPSVEAALVDAGARPAVAACMAQRMTDRLSLAQLQKLKRLRAAPGEQTAGLSAVALVARVQRVNDPEVVAVTAGAAAACVVAN